MFFAIDSFICFRPLLNYAGADALVPNSLYLASQSYHHALSKKKEQSEALEESEKLLPIDTLGIVMIVHGEEFGEDSAFGACITFEVVLSNFDDTTTPFVRHLTGEIGTCPLQGCYIARSICPDVPGHVLDIHTKIWRRHQRIRTAEEEARKQEVTALYKPLMPIQLWLT